MAKINFKQVFYIAIRARLEIHDHDAICLLGHADLVSNKSFYDDLE